VLPRLSYKRFITTTGTRADITGEPAVVATTVATTVTPCVYRKLKSACNGDEVRRGLGAI